MRKLAFLMLIVGAFSSTNVLAQAPNPPQPVDTFQYMVLQRVLDGGIHYIETDSLFFQYNGEYAERNLHYRIKNDFHAVVAEDSLTPQVIFPVVEYYADNRFIIDLSCDGLALAEGFYLLEVFNEKQERWCLKFHKSGEPDCDDEEERAPILNPPPTFIAVVTTFVSIFIPQVKLEKHPNR